MGERVLFLAGVSEHVSIGCVRVEVARTNNNFSFTTKDVCQLPRPMLNNDALACLLGDVFGNALLQCVDVV